MAVVLSNSIILHIPKTAGKWVRWVLRDNNISFFQTSRDISCSGILWHLNGMRSSHCIPYDDYFYKSRENRLCFVRNPVMWYRSYWCFRFQHGWRADSIFDVRTESDSFEIFVDNVLREYPCGFLKDVYQAYVKECNWIGKVESIEEDLITFMKGAEDVEVDCSKTAKINTTPDEVKVKALYRPDQMERIQEIEKEILELYYNE